MRLADTLLDKNKVLIEVKHFSIIMGIVNAYLPVEKLRNFLTSRKLYAMQYHRFGPKTVSPLFRHSSLRVLQGVGVAVDTFEVAAFRQCPRQFYADGTRRIVIMCYQEFVGKTVMVFHFFNLGITLEQVLAEEACRDILRNCLKIIQ